MILPEDYQENTVMRLFELRVDGEKERIAAKNPVEAIKYYVDLTDVELESMEDIIEIPKETWKDIVIKNLEYNEEDPDDMMESWTAEELMKGLKSPEYISTSYNY